LSYHGLRTHKDVPWPPLHGSFGPTKYDTPTLFRPAKATRAAPLRAFARKHEGLSVIRAGRLIAAGHLRFGQIPLTCPVPSEACPSDFKTTYYPSFGTVRRWLVITPDHTSLRGLSDPNRTTTWPYSCTSGIGGLPRVYRYQGISRPRSLSASPGPLITPLAIEVTTVLIGDGPFGRSWLAWMDHRGFPLRGGS